MQRVAFYTIIVGFGSLKYLKFPTVLPPMQSHISTSTKHPHEIQTIPTDDGVNVYCILFRHTVYVQSTKC